jgi:hypothetical protein
MNNATKTKVQERRGQKPWQEVQAQGLEALQCLRKDEYGLVLPIVGRTVKTAEPPYKIRQE